MENNWKDIWNRRKSERSAKLGLEQLINLDGYDAGAGKILPKDWRINAQKIALKMGLKNGDSVYEVGCGSGAFLFALREIHSISIGGNDYSVGLIETAVKAFASTDFYSIEASAIDTRKKYDHVVSNGVFHYFSLEYAGNVLDKMISKAKKTVCILEVPDNNLKYAAESVRRDILTPNEYKKKYVGLEHTYFDRRWFEDIASKHGLHCEIFDGCVPNYAQNRFRFGCIMRTEKVTNAHI